MDTVETPILGLDFRPLHLRYSDMMRGLRVDKPGHLRTDLNAKKIEALARLAKITGQRGLEFPIFDYGLALAMDRFELHAEIQDASLTREERLAKIRENLGRIQAPSVEIRTGVLSFGSTTIRESGVVTLLPATWEAIDEIVSSEFPNHQFILDLSR